jgi:hypothetical protein
VKAFRGRPGSCELAHFRADHRVVSWAAATFGPEFGHRLQK